MTEKKLRIVKKKFGKNCKKIRESKGLSLLAVSYACGLDSSNISKIEHGKVNVALGTIVELSKGLGVSPSELLDY
jgi:transcriptional regulator with XRE-family HTH domain